MDFNVVGAVAQFSVIATVWGAFVFANNAKELKEPIHRFLTFPLHSLSLKARHSCVDQKLVAKCWLTYYTISKFGGVMDMEEVDGDDEIYR